MPDLLAAIDGFASRDVGLLIIDGGDGTVRDVLTAGGLVWGASPPRVLVMPSGKTNALACDLGIPRALRLEHGLDFANGGRMSSRTPIEVQGDPLGSRVVRGFIFGAGAFVEATGLARRAHRAGAFQGLAVGLTVAWSIARTLCSGEGEAWSSGSPMAVSYGADAVPLHGVVPEAAQDRYLMLASTLHRMPLGMRPFGRQRSGMKTLLIDAPPRSVPSSAARLLAGSEARILADRGYHRVDADRIEVSLPSGFVLDGECFPGGEYVLRRGAPIDFVAR